MPLISTTPTVWHIECDLLQCVVCAGPLEAQSEQALVCTACARFYPIHEGILQTLDDLAGNNKVAADFYNGPLWPRFRFWEWLTFVCMGGERRARQQIIRHLGDLTGKRLLEVAIGDGANLPLLPDDCRIYGNDISPVQLRGCQQRYSERGPRLVLGEAERLPFRDRIFDHVLSVGAFNYFSDPVQALREMARVVKPTGLVVVADEMPDLPNWLLGRKLGLPQLDRWIMSRFMKLGPDFTDMVERHRDLKLEPIAHTALDDVRLHVLWRGLGYCLVGRPRS